MSYWDAYMLPVAIRKYMITRYNQIVEEQREAANPNNQTKGNVNDKLTQFEQQIQNKHESLNPSSPKRNSNSNDNSSQKDMSSFMRPVR